MYDSKVNLSGTNSGLTKLNLLNLVILFKNILKGSSRLMCLSYSWPYGFYQVIAS